MTKKTHDILQLKYKILKARYRDSHIDKNLDRKAYTDLTHEINGPAAYQLTISHLSNRQKGNKKNADLAHDVN